MSDPCAALQMAIVTALKADAALDALIEGRVYDFVPDPVKPATTPTFPYLTVGDGQVIGDDNDCADQSEVFFQVHAWSRKPGYPEVKSIAGAVRSAIKAAALSLAGFTITVTQFTQSRFIKDPDGLTRHAVVEFRFLITHG